MVTTTVPASELPGVLANCTDSLPQRNQASVKPTSIVLACGDGNTGTEDLVWTSWTQTDASATGEVWENNCIPDCADGTIEVYPASFSLSDVVTTTSGRVFSQMVAVYRGPGPQGKSSDQFLLPLP